jgi:hypothetical protein
MPRVNPENVGNSGFITVVSGLPRSGTSMMMQMLCVGGMAVLADDARPADADNPRGYFELGASKRIRQDSRWVAGARGKAVKLVHLLLSNLPEGFEYRVVFMHRDLGEVLASQRAMLDRHQLAGADLPPDRLADVFSAQLRRVRGWLDRQPHCSVLDVSYHDVITGPAAQAARVNQFLGGTLDERKMTAAVDPALYRKRGKP